MRLLFCTLILFSANAFSQFNKTDIDDLKADLANYANSKCENERYMESATDIIGKLFAPMSNSITAEQAKANDQLRDALKGVQDAFMASALGKKASCPQKLLEGIKKLDALPVKVKTGNPIVPGQNSSTTSG